MMNRQAVRMLLLDLAGNTVGEPIRSEAEIAKLKRAAYEV